MKRLTTAIAAPLALALAGCADEPAPANGEAASEPAGANAGEAAPTYAATGEITAIAGQRITIAHGPVEAIGWPAMTMGFAVASPDQLRDVSVGDSVRFEFLEADGDYVLTSLSKTQ